MKKDSGITLVVLVSTITIMLILGGIVLRLSVRKDGIIQNIKMNIVQSQIGKEKDILNMSYSALYVEKQWDDMEIVSEELENEIENNGKDATVTSKPDDKNKVIVSFTKTKNIYYLDIKTGNIEYIGTN